jgi:putative endonuclease
MRDHNYFVYITTNPAKTVLYVGVTNNPAARIQQHIDATISKTSFAGKYNCINLIYYEHFQDINHAIEREKEIKKWRREKKENLIRKFNPGWRVLNAEAADL